MLKLKFERLWQLFRIEIWILPYQWIATWNLTDCLSRKPSVPHLIVQSSGHFESSLLRKHPFTFVYLHKTYKWKCQRMGKKKKERRVQISKVQKLNFSNGLYYLCNNMKKLKNLLCSISTYQKHFFQKGLITRLKTGFSFPNRMLHKNAYKISVNRVQN